MIDGMAAMYQESKPADTPAAALRRNRTLAAVTRGKILIVEDEPEIAEMLEYALRRSGFTTVLAEDGLHACRLIERERPDLVLLDVMIPGLDGWEVCRLVRSVPDPEIATTPIIMVTALGSQNDRIKGLELGADGFIPKPYSVREVVLQAGNLVARRRQERIVRGTQCP